MYNTIFILLFCDCSLWNSNGWVSHSVSQWRSTDFWNVPFQKSCDLIHNVDRQEFMSHLQKEIEREMTYNHRNSHPCISTTKSSTGNCLRQVCRSFKISWSLVLSVFRNYTASTTSDVSTAQFPRNRIQPWWYFPYLNNQTKYHTSFDTSA